MLCIFFTNLSNSVLDQLYARVNPMWTKGGGDLVKTKMIHEPQLNARVNVLSTVYGHFSAVTVVYAVDIQSAKISRPRFRASYKSYRAK